MKSCIWLLIAVFCIEVQSISTFQAHSIYNASSEPLSPVYVHTVTPLPISATDIPSQDFTTSSTTSDPPSTEAPTAINFTSTAPNKIKTKSAAPSRTRTIQRLVGGHLQHQSTTRDRSRNDTQTWSDKFAKIYFRRKTSPSRNQPRNFTRFTTTTRRPVRTRRPYKDTLDDAALLEVDSIVNNGIDNWDSGLLRASAGAGKESAKNDTIEKKKEEKTKTLSDQVAEGKYGLIQKEIFQKQPKRPGIISYLPNPDTPGDNNKTYGGLSEDDIWLAEDHLLILKGGSLNKQGEDEWKPIDSYEAPLRQVKIPPNPEVPPPFPVQLDENGPIEFIGNSKVPVFNPFANESLFLYPGASPTSPPVGGYPPNAFAGSGPLGNSSQDPYPYPPPIPPWFLNTNSTFTNPFLNPPPFFGPGFPFPPPFPPRFNGSLENTNITEFDEDDPSLYYPPPYSFVYKSNYTNPVPPGPLVPGIVLPPPPNFFSRLEGDSKSSTPSPVYPSRTTTKLTKHKPIITKLSTTTRPPYIPGRGELHKTYIPPRYEERDNVVVSLPQTTSTTTPQPPTTPTTIKSITTLKKVTPNIIQFVPKIKYPSEDPFRGSNPIYFEYFDARKSANTYLPPVSERTTTTSPPPPAVIPIRNLGYREKPKPIPSVYSEPTTTEAPELYLPHQVNGFDYDKYLYITPQPEIQPNGYTNFGPLGQDNSHLVKPLKISKAPIRPFNQEIETIRQTLKYYKNQITPAEVTQLPRTPKAKAVYEYSFDAVEGSTLKPPLSFNSPIQIDTTPFKPMVQYSAPLGGDINGFKPFSQSVSPTYYSTTPVTPTQYFRKKQSSRTSQRLLPIIQASTENPLPTYYTKKEAALLDDITKKYFNIFGQKLSLAPEYVTEPMSPENIEFTTPTPTVGSTTTPQWISVEKQVFRELNHQARRPGSHRGYNAYSRNIRPLPLPFDGYHYERPEGRPFPSYYSNPPQDPYLRQIALLRQKLRQYPQQQQHESTIPQYELGIVNDTYVNYYNANLGKDREYLTPPLPPHYQHIVNAPNRDTNYFPNRQQQQQQELPISLHTDTLVNYKYPLPAANPDSEFIPPKLQQQQKPQYYNNRNYANPVIQYQLGEQSHVYFITPQDNKYKN